jgi:hypothetical protein
LIFYVLKLKMGTRRVRRKGGTSSWWPWGESRTDRRTKKSWWSWGKAPEQRTTSWNPWANKLPNEDELCLAGSVKNRAKQIANDILRNVTLNTSFKRPLPNVDDAEILKTIQNSEYSYKTTFGCEGTITARYGDGIDADQHGERFPLSKVKFTDMVEPVKRAIVEEIMRDNILDSYGHLRYEDYRKVLLMPSVKAVYDAMPSQIKANYERNFIEKYGEARVNAVGGRRTRRKKMIRRTQGLLRRR